MATDSLRNDFEINGVIDTNKPVWKNIENIANSAGAWVTYDSTAGKYYPIINKTGTSSHSFTDTNIIGPIKVSGTGLDQLYNKCYVSFPLTDVKDSSDTLKINAPGAILKDDEPDNQMNLTYPLVNNPVQAAKLGLLELKQSRVDLVVEFTTDFHQNDVKAGELIDITNDIFSWTNKVFRVLQVKEVDNSKDLLYQITALEYDADVYTFDAGAGQPDYYSITDEDGINTIGELAQCVTPTVTKTQTDRKPHILVETTVPNQAGIVEGVEVWYYKIPDSELPSWQTVDDAARTYNKIFTIRPTGNQTVFPPNQDVEHDISTLEEGNYLFKVRAVNSVTTGPFSDVMGSYSDFQPVQTTDRVTDDTQVDEGSGNILTTFGLAGLIALLNGMMRDNSGGSGSLFEKIFSIFSTEKGFDVGDQSIKDIYDNAQAGYAISYIAGSFKSIQQLNVSIAAGASGNPLNALTTSQDALYRFTNIGTFTPSISGTYQFRSDMNGSFTVGSGNTYYGQTSDMFIRGHDMEITTGNYGSAGTRVLFVNTSAVIDPFGDLTIVDNVSLTAGTTYYIQHFDYCEDKGFAVDPGMNTTVTITKV